MVDDDEDPRVEWKIRAIAIPAAIVLAIGFHASPTGHMLQRTFLSMMVHELGHAVTGWWCGFAALPTLWKTLVPETRSLVITLAIGGVTSFVGWRAWQVRSWPIVAVAAAALVTHVVATFATTIERAQEAITFGGDAGAMILGTLLMLTMFAGPTSRLRTNQLRWGFLVIGAAAFVDTFATWWTARTDPGVIPFGETEGVGLSDPSRLDELYGWSERHIVDRYVAVGVVCLVVLVAIWLRSTLRMRANALASSP